MSGDRVLRHQPEFTREPEYDVPPLPAPDAAGIEAALAAGLAAHADWDYGGPGVIECGGCGWKSERLGPEWNSRKGDRHRAHVAAALLPVVTQAQAEALREAADDLPTADLDGREVDDWLRARADESGAS